MAVTAWTLPAVSGAVGTGNSWNDHTLIKVKNDVGCEAVVDATSTTYLISQGYGWTSLIPAGASILGIEVRIRHQGTGASVKDSVIKLQTNGTLRGDSKASGTAWANGSWEDITYGGAADLWGNAATDLYAWIMGGATFGAAVRARWDAVGAGAALVDSHEMRVYYAPPAHYHRGQQQ